MKDEGQYLAEGASVEVPRGMNGNKRPIAIVEHAIARCHGPRTDFPTTKQRACRFVRSLSAMWIATKFR